MLGGVAAGWLRASIPGKHLDAAGRAAEMLFPSCSCKLSPAQGQEKKMGRECLCRKHHVPPLAGPRSCSFPQCLPRSTGGSGGCTVTCGTLSAPGAAKPGSGLGRDCHGGREQAEALTIENKDFIIFFQFTGQFHYTP